MEPKKRVFKFKRGTLFRCWSCPREHPGWMRSQLRRCRGRDYCVPHRPPPPKHTPCPKCKSASFPDFFKWKGSVMKTLACCMACGFEDKATKFCDKLTIKILASPIEDGR